MAEAVVSLDGGAVVPGLAWNHRYREGGETHAEPSRDHARRAGSTYCAGVKLPRTTSLVERNVWRLVSPP